MKEYLVKTWRCSNFPSCLYSWQFEGNAANSKPQDLSIDELKIQFPEDAFVGLMPGQCPSCYANKNNGELYEVVGGEARVFVSEESDIEAETANDTDSSGNTILEVVDVKKEVAIVDGKVDLVDVEIKEPAQRPLNKQEKLDRLDGVRKAEDSLQKIAVSEK